MIFAALCCEPVDLDKCRSGRWMQINRNLNLHLQPPKESCREPSSTWTMVTRIWTCSLYIYLLSCWRITPGRNSLFRSWYYYLCTPQKNLQIDSTLSARRLDGQGKLSTSVKIFEQKLLNLCVWCSGEIMSASEIALSRHWTRQDDHEKTSKLMWG